MERRDAGGLQASTISFARSSLYSSSTRATLQGQEAAGRLGQCQVWVVDNASGAQRSRSCRPGRLPTPPVTRLHPQRPVGLTRTRMDLSADLSRSLLLTTTHFFSLLGHAVPPPAQALSVAPFDTRNSQRSAASVAHAPLLQAQGPPRRSAVLLVPPQLVLSSPESTPSGSL